MLTCFCGNLLISDGKIWSCPKSGSVESYGTEKGNHIGRILPDKRINAHQKINDAS